MSTDSAVPLPQRFDVTPHVSDGGGGSLAGTLQLISILCTVGILLGLAVSFLSQWIYLIVVFPILMGFVVGWVGKKTIERYKIRKPLACGIAGFLAGCFCFLAMHYSSYLRFESELENVPVEVREIARHIDELTAAGDQVPAEVREVIAQLRASPKQLDVLRVGNFWEYMDLLAKEGVTISEVGKGGNGINLGYVGSIIYWGVEALILAVIALGLMKNAAARPFCVECDSWKHETTLIMIPGHSKAIAESVRQGDLVAIEQALTTVDAKKIKPGLFTKITACVCANCESNIPIEVKVANIAVQSNGQQAESKVVQITYPTEALEPLQAMASRLQSPTS